MAVRNKITLHLTEINSNSCDHIFSQIVEKGSMVSSPTSHLMLSRMRFRHLASSLVVIRVVYHYREFFSRVLSYESSIDRRSLSLSPD